MQASCLLLCMAAATIGYNAGRGRSGGVVWGGSDCF